MSEVLIQPTGLPGRVLSSDGSIAISIPVQIKRRSGRKHITLPSGEPLKPAALIPPPTTLQSAPASQSTLPHRLRLLPASQQNLVTKH